MMASSRTPKTRAGGEWTESKYWTFIRSNLRLMSRKWPPIQQTLVGARRPSQSENKRLKWEFQCASCSEWFPRDGVQVDHFKECGSLRCSADIVPFIETLLCESDNLYVLCSVCHANKKEILAAIPD
jgi:ribosomal protein L44E